MQNLVFKRKRKKWDEISSGWNAVWTIFLTLMAAIFVAPVLLVVCVSLSSAESITHNGYKFIPDEWTLQAYKSILEVGSSIFQSYKMTIFYAVVGTLLGLFVMSMFAYALAKKDFKFRNQLAFLTFFTTLFSGGLVPHYVLYTRYLHINDTIWVYLLPGLVSAFDVIVLRTFIQTSIPDSLFDAAKIDGANDWSIYCRVVLPLFKAGLATVGLFNFVAAWNDWFKGIMYIEDPDLVPIMTYLQRIQKDIDFLRNNSDAAMTEEGMELLKNLPSESVRMAITIFAVFPLLVAYPFFQKYFVKGLTVGSVKG